MIIPNKLNNKKITEIANFAFLNQLKPNKYPYKKTVLSSHSRKIGVEAFSQNNIEELVLPSSLITIREDAFANNRIKNVRFSEGVTKLEAGAFSKNQITKLTLLNSIKIISDEAFLQNNINGQLILPEKLTHIGVSAFKNNQLE